MTILPQKPRSQKVPDKPPSSTVPEISEPTQGDIQSNRPSTSRAAFTNQNTSSSVISGAVTSNITGSNGSLAEAVERRLVKSLKRASATPPLGSISAAPTKKSSSKVSKLSSQIEVNPSSEEAHNSEDEYLENDEDLNPAILLERENRFERMMKEKGFTLRRMAEDGGCLFRAVADQVYGDQRWHDVVRRQCIDHMEKNRDFYSAFVTEEFDEYLKRKRRMDCYGNNIEIQAMSEIYGRPVEIYRYSTEPINIFQASTSSSYPPLRLSYHNRSHYNSLVSPYEATVGVGLGLPGYQPGLADLNLMRDATIMSENCELEKAMLEDKLRETDWERTNDELEKQVARESYLSWLREEEDRLLGSNQHENSAFSETSHCDIPSTSQKSPRTSRSSPRSTSNLMNSSNKCSTNSTESEQPPSSLTPSTSHSCPVLASNQPIVQQNNDFVNSISWEDFINDDANEQEIMLAVIARSQEDYINSFSNDKQSKSHQIHELPSTSTSPPRIVRGRVNSDDQKNNRSSSPKTIKDEIALESIAGESSNS